MVKLKEQGKGAQRIGSFLILLAAIVLVNIVSESYYWRFDLTKEKRYTLSSSTEALLDKLEDDVFVQVYLEGEIPVEYKRLRSAVKDMLNEYRYASGGKFHVTFIDLLKDKSEQEQRAIIDQKLEEGVQVEVPEVQEGDVATRYIFPSAQILYKGRDYPLNFLKREFGQALANEVNGSIELLEYEIGNVIRKCVTGRDIKLAFLDGHSELGDFQIYDIAKELGEFYAVERININISDTNCTKYFIKELTENPGRESEALIEGLIHRLSRYAGLIVAKPTLPFKEVEKFVLDQYVMNGGKIIWLVESLIAESDSLWTNGGRFFTAMHEHNLNDLLFNYGARLEATLIEDLNCHGMPLINDRTNRAVFHSWWFYPLFNPADENLITRNLETVLGRYVTSIDTTSNPAARKTMLLQSSPSSRVTHNPVPVSLSQLSIRPDQANFSNGNQVAAVLLEGGFRSAFKTRPGYRRNLDIEFKDSVADNAMIVIGDGDLIRNDVSEDRSVIYPLGLDNDASEHFKERIFFANKKFFLNCVDYLCDPSNLIEVRSKKVVLRLLDKAKVKAERRFWQWINMGIPMLLIAIFGLINALYRKRRWS